MKHLWLAVLLLTSLSALAQDLLPPASPSTITVPSPGRVTSFGVGSTNQLLGSAPRGHALGFLNVTDFGLSGRAYVSLSRQQPITTELSFGFLRMNPSYIPETYLNGYVYSQGLFVLPAYLGIRMKLAESRTGSVLWNWYVRGGGGPAVGMLTPLGLGFLESVGSTAFIWGVGAYAATGLEFDFDGPFQVFVQTGVDYNAFFRRIGNSSSFIGPSFAIGFGRLIP